MVYTNCSPSCTVAGAVFVIPASAANKGACGPVKTGRDNIENKEKISKMGVEGNRLFIVVLHLE
jgi:hypothetical protein